MTRIATTSPSRGVAAALVATIAGGLMLAAPAQAQRPSINSLANDHVNILSKVEDTNGVVQQILPKVEGPVPVTACGPINVRGSYRLVNNLATVGDCIVINADFVTLDMAGFAITGDGETGTGIGDGSPVGEGENGVMVRRGIKVHNGTVANFFVGVGLFFTKSAVVKHVRAADNIFRGIATGPSSIVKGNTAFDNLVDGIQVGSGSKVSWNTADSNGQFGFNVGAGSVVHGNTAIGNATGFIVLGGSTVQGNAASFNTGSWGFNILCAAVAPSNVIGNTATNNAGVNLFLNGPVCNTDNNVAP